MTDLTSLRKAKPADISEGRAGCLMTEGLVVLIPLFASLLLYPWARLNPKLQPLLVCEWEVLISLNWTTE